MDLKLYIIITIAPLFLLTRIKRVFTFISSKTLNIVDGSFNDPFRNYSLNWKLLSVI